MKLFLDDYRLPSHVAAYVLPGDVLYNILYGIYANNEDWVVVKDYSEFVTYLTNNGLKDIDFISLDHDLVKEHYPTRNGEPIDYSKYTEPTGLACAEYLIDFCKANEIPLPTTVCHSMNIVGGANIRKLLAKAKGLV